MDMRTPPIDTSKLLSPWLEDAAWGGGGVKCVVWVLCSVCVVRCVCCALYVLCADMWI